MTNQKKERSDIEVKMAENQWNVIMKKRENKAVISENDDNGVIISNRHLTSIKYYYGNDEINENIIKVFSNDNINGPVINAKT